MIENQMAKMANRGSRSMPLDYEALGLLYHDGALYSAQRGELTKLMDKNGDGKADVYETVYAWPISGHYHEYSLALKLGPDGNFFVSGNVAFGQEWWRGEKAGAVARLDIQDNAWWTTATVGNGRALARWTWCCGWRVFMHR